MFIHGRNAHAALPLAQKHGSTVVIRGARVLLPPTSQSLIQINQVAQSCQASSDQHLLAVVQAAMCIQHT
jgi:hypothetical protein